MEMDLNQNLGQNDHAVNFLGMMNLGTSISVLYYNNLLSYANKFSCFN